VLSLEDALALVAERGRLMQSMPAGSMLAVPLPEPEVAPYLLGNISLAAVNRPDICVLSGPTPEIEALERELEAQGIEPRRLHTSHAFHSAMMDPILPAFEAAVRRVTLRPMPAFTDLAGIPMTPTQRLLRDYLRDCRGAGVEPRRVVLTFAPCGREKTLAFMRWLGVNITAETERVVLGAADPIRKSIEICCDNLRQILDGAYAAAIPLGINVESVSIRKEEIEAATELFKALRRRLGR